MINFFYITIVLNLFSNDPFKQYPVAVSKNNSFSKHKFHFSKEANRFKTKIQQAQNQSPNFAGNCILVEWGCGTGCQQSAIIDLQDGKIILGPSSSTGFLFKRDSRLLVVNPKDEEAMDYINKTSQYYLWEHHSLKYLRSELW